MTDYKKATFGERLSDSAKAKNAELERLRAKLAAPDPKHVAARLAVQAARDEREARRKAEADKQRALELAEQARLDAEREAAREAERLAQEAEDAARKAEAGERAAREAALKLEQKAARDARYAARKKRK